MPASARGSESLLVPASLPALRWRLEGGDRLCLSGLDGAVVAVLPLGAEALGARFFRQDPPRPQALEEAIDVIEEAVAEAAPAVAAWVGRHVEPGAPWAFVTDDEALRALPGADGRSAAEAGQPLTQAEVESLFQRLASASLGHPTAARGLPSGARSAAALLLLRETLHHFGVAALRWG